MAKSEGQQLYQDFLDARRIAYPISIAALDGHEHALEGSRVGGSPCARKEESWPTGLLARPMVFLVQMDLGALPGPLSVALPYRIVTVYGDPHEGRFRSDRLVFRTYASADGCELARPPESVDDTGRIAYPLSAGEATLLGPDLRDLELLRGTELPTSPLPAEVQEALKRDDDARLSGFFGGFPLWLNGYQQPLCKLCGTLMSQLLQLDQNELEGSVYLGAGAIGLAHLFVCATHPEELQTAVSPLS